MIDMDKNKDTKICPSCTKEISAKAKRCPHCTQDLRSWFIRHPILTFLLIIVTSPFWIAILVGFTQGLTSSSSSESTDTTPTPVKQTELNARVHFTGTQFEISNLDKYDCQNARMEINGGLFKGGYSLDGYILEAGHGYTVGAAQFTDKDGNRFNPFSIKPQNYSISCRGDNEMSSAFWYGEFQ